MGKSEVIRRDIAKRNNVTVLGRGDRTLMLAHGFGCDQNMWRYLTPLLPDGFRIVLFDYVGSGKSDAAAYDMRRYSSLEGYAQDIIEICDALDLRNVTLVGHSVSAMIGLIASIEAPQYFSALVMICPSPYFLNVPPEYRGGFEREDLEELIDLMDKNYIGWANYLSPLVMGVQNGTRLIEELADSFCSTDPVVAKTFAKATFFTDSRPLLARARHPVLVFQSSADALASVRVGEYVVAALPRAEMALISADGHCLHMTNPQELVPGLVRFALAHGP